MRRANVALGAGVGAWYVIGMWKMAALRFGLALVLGCNETTVIINGGDGGPGGEAGMAGSGGEAGDGGSGGSAGSGGTSGSGGSAGSGGMGGDAGSGGSGGEAGSGGAGGSGGSGGSAGSGGSGGSAGSGGIAGSGGGGMPCGEVPAGAFVIADSEFLDSDWEAEAIATPGAVIEWPIVRETSGGLGNSPYRNMTHSIGPATDCGGSCSLFVVHERLAATYNPSQQGAIGYIDYTEAQRILVPAFEGDAVDWRFAVIQNGRRYNLFTAPPAFSNLNWATSGLCGLTAEDFGFPPDTHPDFSDTGAELTFAYMRTNTNTSETSTSTSVHGIDDFKVVIVGE